MSQTNLHWSSFWIKRLDWLNSAAKYVGKCKKCSYFTTSKIVTHYQVGFSVCSYIRFQANFLNLPLKNPMLKTAKICLVCIVVSKCNEQIYEIDRPDRKKANFTIVCYDVRKKCIFFSRSALIGPYSQAECFQKWSHPLWESFCSQD